MLAPFVDRARRAREMSFAMARSALSARSAMMPPVAQALPARQDRPPSLIPRDKDEPRAVQDTSRIRAPRAAKPGLARMTDRSARKPQMRAEPPMRKYLHATGPLHAVGSDAISGGSRLHRDIRSDAEHPGFHLLEGDNACDIAAMIGLPSPVGPAPCSLQWA